MFRNSVLSAIIVYWFAAEHKPKKQDKTRNNNSYNTHSTNQPNDVAAPRQICQMLGYVLLWLWKMQSEPLEGDASHMKAVNSTNIARLGDVFKVIGRFAEENGHTFTQSERVPLLRRRVG
jgi:hypothetical protein